MQTTRLHRAGADLPSRGPALYAPFDVVFSDFDVVEPDLRYMPNERAALILTAQHAPGVPELVIEIASPGTERGT